MTRPASNCSSLIPQAWQSPIPGAPLPANDTIGEWTKFADAQTGQLDKANDRVLATISIVGRCEQRDAEVIKELTKKPWYKFW
jgi:hypothetical protein